MDAERLQRSLDELNKSILNHEERLLKLAASVLALKVSVGMLRGQDAKSALDEFQEIEEGLLKEMPSLQKLNDVRDLLTLVMEHETKIGKHRA